MTHFDVSSHREAGALVVVPEGELDIAAVRAVRASLDEREPGERLVVDLRELTFLDTSGLQVLVETYRAAREEGFELRVLRARPAVQRVFEIAGLDAVLPFADGAADG